MVLPTRAQVLQLYARVKQPLPLTPPPPSRYTSHLTPSQTTHSFAALESHFFNPSPSSSSSSSSPFSSSLSFTSHDPDEAVDAALAASHSSPLHPARHRTLLGLDVGERHIGVAVSDATLTLPTPLPCLTRHPHSPQSPLIAALTSLLTTHSAAALVVGLPLDPHTLALTPQAHRIQAITASLLVSLPHPRPLLVWWDEAYSSRQSREVVREAGLDVRRMKEKGLVDSGAATIILQSFLDHLRAIVAGERNRLRHERRQQRQQEREATAAATSDTSSTPSSPPPASLA